CLPSSDLRPFVITSMSTSTSSSFPACVILSSFNASPARTIRASSFPLLPSDLCPLVRRNWSPASHRQRCQHDFHCERAKDESHHTHQDGRAIPTDHSQNRIRKKQ